MVKITPDELFRIARKTFIKLPDKDKAHFLKDIATVITKYTEGKAGNVGGWDIEIWCAKESSLFARIINLIRGH